MNQTYLWGTGGLISIASPTKVDQKLEETFNLHQTLGKTHFGASPASNCRLHHHMRVEHTQKDPFPANARVIKSHSSLKINENMESLPAPIAKQDNDENPQLPNSSSQIAEVRHQCWHCFTNSWGVIQMVIAHLERSLAIACRQEGYKAKEGSPAQQKRRILRDLWCIQIAKHAV